MQQRSEETRAAILAAAQRLFAQNGYDATGVAEICQAAGVSKGAFYHHFPSKQAVFLDLLETWLAWLEPRLLAFAQDTEDTAAAFVRMSAVFHDIFASGAGQLPMFLEFWIQARRDPAVWEATIAPYHRFQRMFAGIMEKGIRQGFLRPMDSRHASQVMMSLSIGLILQGLFDPDGANWEQVSQEGIGLLMDGMKRSAV